MALIKLVGKAFTVCIISTKTVKGFFSLAFIIFTVVYQEWIIGGSKRFLIPYSTHFRIFVNLAMY